MNSERPYILLADDDPDDLALFTQAFCEANPHARVEAFADGQEILDYLGSCSEDELPSLILLDYKMHVVTGPEVLQQLSSDVRLAHIPVVVWSTSERSEDIENCVHLGAAGYFLKPASSAELNVLVQKIELICAAQLQQ
ncbi:MAG TPA: response regulator [Puia sp.]|nr:response regulator [Puia sp.]